jgi:SprB repeat
MRSHLLLLPALLVSVLATAQQIVQAEYFIGNDPGPGNGIPISIAADNTVLLNSSLSTAQLSVGFNSIALRTKGASGLWSNTSKRSFFIEASSAGGNLLYHEITAAEYFVDVDPGPGQATPLDITTGVDVDFAGSVLANLSPGFHKIAVRTLSNSGLWSATKSRHFVVQASHPGGDMTYHEIVAAEYFVDTDPGPGHANSIDITAGSDVSLIGSILADMPAGVHKLCIRTQATSGVWSSTSSRIFIVKSGGISSFYEVVAAEYFIDTDPGEGLGTPVSITSGSNVIAEGQVPTDTLAIGIHTMGIRFKGSTGIWCAPELAQFTLVEEVPFTFNVILENPSCAGLSDGFIQLNVNADLTQFAYAWNGISGESSLNGIPSGEYQLEVSNLFGENVLDTLFTLVGPEPILIDGIVNDVLCAGETTGNINAFATGGTGTITLDWGGANPQALATGTYEVIVTDANGCAASNSFTVSEPAPLVLALVNTSPNTNDLLCNGSIEVSASGGTPSYSILWSDPAQQSSYSPSNLCEGTYEATLTDSNGCITTLSVDLLTSEMDEEHMAISTCFAAPNPTQGSWMLIFELAQATQATMEVIDETGRIVKQENNLYLSSGRSQHTFDWKGMASGNYLVSIHSRAFSENIRLTILP